MKSILMIFICSVSLIGCAAMDNSRIDRLESEIKQLKSDNALLSEKISALSGKIDLLVSLSQNKSTVKQDEPAYQPSTQPTAEQMSALGNNQPEQPVKDKSSEKKVKSSEQTSSQCMATTKKGKRCSRKAAPGSNYCWQHG